MLDSRFDKWFDLHDTTEDDHFKLLRSAYVDARYKKDFMVTEDQLSYLEKKVQRLKEQVVVVCEEEIG